MNTLKYWTPVQIRNFVKAMRREVGDGWTWLTPRVQEALVSERALQILRQQDREAVPVAMMDELVMAMMVEAGLAV